MFARDSVATVKQLGAGALAILLACGCSLRPANELSPKPSRKDAQMNEHLEVLEAAISDVGVWTWWTANLPDTFQVEFSAAQLWNPPAEEGKPPSSQVALRFRKPRIVYFLSLDTGIPEDWPDRLHRDELPPPGAAVTLTSEDMCKELLTKAVAIRPLVGEPGVTPPPKRSDAFLGIRAGSFGLVVAAESMVVLSHHGELSEAAVLESSAKWWRYWQDYWRLKDTPEQLPRDHVCEVTIPVAPEAEPGVGADSR